MTALLITERTMEGAANEVVELRHVEEVMGTVFSIAVSTDSAARVRSKAAIIRAVAWLHEVDRRFTTYRPGSEWLRYVAGDLRLDDAHADLREVAVRVDRLRQETRGAFDIAADRSRPPDPAAYVKGWATQRAADLLIEAGARSVCISGGGDVAVRGGDRPWRIGIQDPFRPDGILGVVELAEGAVATSGTYERGLHLYDPADHRPVTAFAGVTVVGPDLGLADAYATALFVAGPAGTDWFDALIDYRAFLIHPDRRTTTIGFS